MMNKKTKKKFLLKTAFTALIASAALPIAFSANVNHQVSKVSNSLNATEAQTRTTNNFRLSTSNAANGYNEYRLLDSSGTDQGIGIKVPNFTNTSESAQNTANTILQMYSGLPSVVSTKGDSTEYSDWSISNLISIDATKWQTSGTNVAKIFNLSSYSTYKNNYQNNSTSTATPTAFNNLDADNTLPAFADLRISDDNTQQVTENYLDSLGLLCLQITVTQATNASTGGATWQSFYVMIPGFGGSLKSSKVTKNNIMLPSNYYASGVSSVSNDNLVSYLNSSWENTKGNVSRPNITISSRNNNASSGEMSFTSTFSFDTNIEGSQSNVSLKDSFNGIVDSSTTSFSQTTNQHISVDAGTNVYDTAISYSRTFVSTGFQPSPVVSNQEVIIITSVIIGIIFCLCVLAYIVSLYTRKLRFRNSM
ncbi:hypothetical protein D8X55_03425 [Malacoplasma penetrans]|uniref:hypothetical protein n=1 Tax=Malacoplasma penetrans TaxID=28227 RepID=UPI0010129AD4|nr:hypothetical protein [Malacoplasma penetrans]RXY96498.1 hypothetical protein D8X55_03425 [Malacoplasma penetrans]